jgi:hypothetical protein
MIRHLFLVPVVKLAFGDDLGGTFQIQIGVFAATLMGHTRRVDPAII